MSAALKFREEMRGHVAFGDQDYREGQHRGRERGTRLVLALTVVVEDVDAFIAKPGRRAFVRGRIEFDELGISLPIQRGEMRLLLGPNEGPHRVYYCVGVRTERDEWVTVRGRKLLRRDDQRGAWSQLTELETRVLAGPPDLSRTEDERGDRERTIATGILQLGVTGVVANVASSRAPASSRIAGGIAAARFWGAVADAAADLYVPRVFNLKRQEHAVERVAAPQTLKHWGEGRELRVEWHRMKDAPGSLAELEHVTMADAPPPDNGPVLLVAGSSVAASIFRPVGVDETLIHRLIDKGFDVWVESWRGSLGHPPLEYSLDEAAALDHPSAVKWLAEKTNSPDVKAVVHCLGSASFMLALASGRLHDKEGKFQVTNVVSNSVSLHPVIPRSSERKLRAVTPFVSRLVPYLDARWAQGQASPDTEPLTDDDKAERDPTGPIPGSALSRGLVQWVDRTRRSSDGEGPVSSFHQWMYGGKRSTLYDPRTLNKETLEWLETQFAWAPLRLYKQIGRSLRAGHLVPMRDWTEDELQPDLFRTGPADVETQITFMAGTENRCFSPSSQRRTFEWFSKYQGRDKHRLVDLPGFGHLDVWLRPDSPTVFDKIVEGLLDRADPADPRGRGQP